MAQTRRILTYYQYTGSFSVKILVFEPPGVPIYRVPINCYATDIEDITSKFNPNAFFVVTLCILMAQTRRILAYYQYSGSFSFKILVFDPLECPFIGFPHLLCNLYWRYSIKV